jgi:hypothetical protein
VKTEIIRALINDSREERPFNLGRNFL